MARAVRTGANALCQPFAASVVSAKQKLTIFDTFLGK
jgi:hypothetical protein